MVASGGGALASADVLKVVGGGTKGGIIVREAKDTASLELSGRLSTGALVRVVEHDGARLRYEMLAGEGPASGWVSTAVKGKDLLAKTNWTQAPGELRTNEVSNIPTELEYDLGLKAGALDMRQDQISVLTQDLATRTAKTLLEDAGAAAEDSDGEAVVLCCRCHLPVGSMAYSGEDGAVVHGECMAQVLLCNMRDQEELRQEKAQALKNERRAAHGIGWNVERVPCNLGCAEKLECKLAPTEMCCLVLEEDPLSVRVGKTSEPAEAVNLEYLSIALRVRRSEGREPLFSLDPVLPKVVPCSYGTRMQVKRFEPAWLEGTSVGEVMFQADYYLKELSMGEHEQPVVGMKSCLESYEDTMLDTWLAREWFKVRKAEVHMTEGNALIPFVKMGVEAREQAMGTDGLEDARITREDHPLVKYAESFTNNFDLIAERKSVVYQLREVAKASVLAKFLHDVSMELEEPWFNLASETEVPSCSKIPMLWNDRCHSDIELKDGEVIDSEKGAGARMRGVYGGIDFGLDKFEVPAFVPYQTRLARIPVRTAYPTALPIPAHKSPLAFVGRTPKGVDLNLNGFDLSSVMQRTTEARAGSWGDGGFGAPSSTFWLNLEGRGDKGALALKDADRSLLRDIYNPHLSDRRNDGDEFALPDSSFLYVDQLRNLVKAEKSVQQQRRQHFFSDEFVMEDAGPLFPASWTSSFKIARGQEKAPRQRDFLLARPDYADKAPLLECLMKSKAPVFEKSAEDGSKFRIYRFGSLEVRTTQEHDGEEVIGVVYSVHASGQECTPHDQGQGAADHEQIVEVTQYVERALANGEQHPQMQPFCRRYYVVFRTAEGNAIVTEKLKDRKATWEENPKDLEDRNSLAKVLSTAHSLDSGATVGSLRLQYVQANSNKSGASSTSCKRYSRDAYGWALGKRAFAVVTYNYSDAARHPTSRPGEKNVFERLFSERECVRTRPRTSFQH